MLDATGFTRPRYDDLFTDMEAKAKATEAFGSEANTSESTPLGAILRVVAYYLADLWENVEDVYNSAYKNAAVGVQLDKIGPYVGTMRTLAQRATGLVQIVGTPDYKVPVGFRAATETGVVFETTSAAVLIGGSGTAAIRAVDAGAAGNVKAGTITVIVNPSADVTTVTNAAETAGGREKETDEEFRAKWDNSVAGGGSATVDAIRSAVLRVTGVRAAAVFENNTMSTDQAGRPPKSVQVYALSGDAQTIGAAIFSRTAGGIETYGSTAVTVKDLSGLEHLVKFSPADVVRIYARVVVTHNASYPADGDAQVKQVLIKFIGGEAADGTVFAGLSMDDDVVHARLIAVLYTVPGVDDVTLTLSTDGVAFAAANIPIDSSQVAQLDATDIEVTAS